MTADWLSADPLRRRRQRKAHLEAHGFKIANFVNLQNVANSYDTTAERPRLGRLVNREDADAVFLSSSGMPTLPTLKVLEQDLRKPVTSNSSAMMCHALCLPASGQPFRLLGAKF